MKPNLADTEFPEAPAPLPAWTGRLRFGLLNGRSWPIGDAEVVIRPDTVTLSFAERTLAVMERTRLRSWLTCREVPYEVDSVVWSDDGDPLAAGSAGLLIDGRATYFVENCTMSVLTGLI